MPKIADADKNNWVDRFAPAFLTPYLKLARADRPIGIWLLLFPCWWSFALSGGAQNSLQNLWYLLLFFIGAVVMRAAGCVYNDILDRDIDAQVERTKLRPIPSGQVTVKQALIFMLFCCFAGLLVLLQFNMFTIILGMGSLAIVAVYPLMKRITYWPQFVLGLAFSWGALMGWACIKEEVSLAPIFMYAAVVCWTIGYDTIYAHQDKEDDALLGLKSTALRFGERTPYWLSLFYGFTIGFLFLAGIFAEASIYYYIGLLVAVAHLIWQILSLDINDGAKCLAIFKSNRDLGFIVFIAIVAGHLAHF